MVKTLVLTASAIALLATGAIHPAMADDHGKMGKGDMMEKIDTDGDGQVSKAEFLKSHEDRFSELDTDGNGYISAEEHQAFKEEMQEKFKNKREEWRAKKEAGETVEPEVDTAE